MSPRCLDCHQPLDDHLPEVHEAATRRWGKKMLELKPCPVPWCGCPAEYVACIPDDSSGICCTNEDCAMAEAYAPIERWNSRPEEDALLAEVERLKGERDQREKAIRAHKKYWDVNLDDRLITEDDAALYRDSGIKWEAKG